MQPLLPQLPTYLLNRVGPSNPL
uniref:Uncharacterized protein n=1 Tax=Rhizophora mucronata TaxID=61149 RepID=A0A2P2R275_RHIMU